MKLFWYKTNDLGIIPSKRPEDAGFDIYSCIDSYLLMPGEKHLFPTGIAAAAEPGWWLLAFDRGSTGSKGIHTHCGIIDNGYRGEIFICLCNDNSYPVKFCRDTMKIEYNHMDFYYDRDGKEQIGPILYYPLSKAIAQIIPIPQPQVESTEATEEEWEAMSNTERGDSKLGASGK